MPRDSHASLHIESYMMKKLLFMAMLLAPGLAYGQNPSADLSVQVVSANTGIPCAIGKPYTANGGQVPAGAAAAGFTACALNIDMSQAYYQTLSNWIDCSADPGTAAATPVMYNDPGGWGNGSKCADSPAPYTVVNDGGVMALKTLLPSGLTDTKSASINSTKNNYTAGQLFPNSMYVEVRYRLDGARCGQTGTYPAACTPVGVYDYVSGVNPSGSPFFEFDWIETFVSSGEPSGGQNQEHLHPSNNGTGMNAPGEYDNFGGGLCCGYVFHLALNQQQYHTYGERMVSDGAANLSGTTSGHMTWCAYHDGTQDGCQAGTYSNNAGVPVDTFSNRVLMKLENYVVNRSGVSPVPINFTPNPQIGYITNYAIFVCPGWRSGVATGMTPTGGACLNSTADVTARLAGPP
jgi:hypothetical protein